MLRYPKRIRTGTSELLVFQIAVNLLQSLVEMSQTYLILLCTYF